MTWENIAYNFFKRKLLFFFNFCVDLQNEYQPLISSLPGRPVCEECGSAVTLTNTPGTPGPPPTIFRG